MSSDQIQEKSALFVATLTSFMSPFMSSAVNVALPAIQKEFAVNAIQLSWIATSYLLALTVTLMPIGRIADIHGRKKVFAWGLVFFTSATLLVPFSRSVEMLIFLRTAQGFGGAMSITTGMAILTSVFPPHRRGNVLGIYATAVYIGLSLGPFAGGILTRHLGWRSIFWIVVPLGIASVFVTYKYLKGEWADARGEELDISGSILYGVFILALVYGASIIPDVKSIFLVVFGMICLCLFIRQELTVRFPVFEIRLFTQNKLFAFSSLAALINYSATFAVTFLLSLYLQYIKGLSPQFAGTILVAQPIVMAIFSPLAGKWSDRIEPRKIASAGMAITALGLFLFALIGSETEKVSIVCNLAMLGFGFAMFSSPNMNAIMGSVEKKFFGIASGTVATMRVLGQMTSMATVMIIFAVFIGREEISLTNYDLFLNSIKVAFVVFALFCLLGIFFSFFRGRLRNNNHPPDKTGC